MKPVKNFVFALLLVSAMAVTTSAGEQNTPAYVPPPPPDPAKSMTTSYDPVTGGFDTEPTGGVTADTSDYLLLEALAALLSVY